MFGKAVWGVLKTTYTEINLQKMKPASFSFIDLIWHVPTNELWLDFWLWLSDNAKSEICLLCFTCRSLVFLDSQSFIISTFNGKFHVCSLWPQTLLPCLQRTRVRKKKLAHGGTCAMSTWVYSTICGTP